MKKTLTVVMSLFLLFVTGCASDTQKADNIQTNVNEQTQSVPQNQENIPTTDDSPIVTDNTTYTGEHIGEQKAKQIALERAGLTEDEVVFERVELDFDDGIYVYEIEFRKDKIEYDVEIKSDDGTILSFETDYDD